MPTSRAEALYTLNALEAPALYSRLAEFRLEDRRFEGTGLREILSFVAEQTALQLACETATERKFEVRTVGASGRAGALLIHLMRRGEGEFALLLDEAGRRLRAVPLATALDHWRRAIEGR